MAYKVSDHVAHRTKDEAKPPTNPLDYEKMVFQRGLDLQRPPFTFQADQWQPQAEARMSAESKGYVSGNAGTGETCRKNREAFQRWSIVPNRLIKTEGLPDISTEVLGTKVPFPIAVAPVGVQKIFTPGGEIASARAAAQESVPYIMSTASSATIEEVAEANGSATRWYQLYWPSRDHDDITISILERAKTAGFTTLFVTLDTYILGWRPSDMDNGFDPFLKSDSVGVAIGFSDPVFRKHFKEKHGKEIEEDMHSVAGEWTNIHWDGARVLKGIQSVADAKKCAEIGVQGIVVSNHGGRQVDGGAGSLSMLPRIVDAVGHKMDVLFDSGIRCGADMIKALALGAKTVLIGRPYVHGLVLGGQDGVSHVLKSLLGDLELTLHLAGIPSVSRKHLNRDVLEREDRL
ncbi:FMN-dependent alpha-hydroxy acid dehydrogenase [Teratosphaeria nubilosa]|uniref:FMN-dependent alpha-hydroxy acid dehydrogenase n=1 Tax=Teratosphaeria nubilosa TaxID=161662 RepID=A0A6G1KW08_9PEZI|nr:FMN-dependent alpha-hydroxy acid dehydrogenase [Teratosphaeria nubilosa]